MLKIGASQVTLALAVALLAACLVPYHGYIFSSGIGYVLYQVRPGVLPVFADTWLFVVQTSVSTRCLVIIPFLFH
ncbi:hypothetical protein CORC01_01897 [Colletotrichum orchidophilum]|uniref:Uncharacterized protein n=1 Tax=Colletotrichum orchidophilum TaxID=1209926 RepID=A0A1G4BNC9_9PEZI|nr:uncharacterized protein CORC01_01897 [Colletotrichum orchidophilum]OHF02796.1 hypothetical protein CORC01_01897 [Colletotrichum orchidophilum]